MWDKMHRDDKILMIRDGVRRGLSSTKIAEEIGGCTRNAVIGLAMRCKIQLIPTSQSQARMDVSSRAPRRRRPTVADVVIGHPGDSPAPPARRDPVPPKQRPVPPPAAIAKVVISVPVLRMIPLTELNDYVCRWPSGDPLDESFGFCGAPKDYEGSYCRFHHRLAYQPPQARRVR